MSKADADSFAVRLERSRRRAGFTSPRDAADHFGWNENTYKAREGGLRGMPRDQDEVRRYAKAYNVPFLWLLSGEGPAPDWADAETAVVLKSPPILEQPTNDAPLHYRPPPQFLGDRDLPVFAAVEGGPGEMVVNTDPIEWVQRPWFMREVKDGYAVVVTGESMIPVYEPGDMVIVNPRLPAIRNKNAIFVGGEDRGEFRATVKRLERSTVKDWHVKQWNPPDGGSQELVLNKALWPKALRIVGKYEGG